MVPGFKIWDVRPAEDVRPDLFLTDKTGRLFVTDKNRKTKSLVKASNGNLIDVVDMLD